MWIEWLGFVAAGLTTFSFLPQLIKVIATRSTEDISLLMFALMALGIFLWLVYGILIHSGPLIFSNGLTLIFVLAILGFKLFEKKL